VLLDHNADDSAIEIVVVFYTADDEIAIVKSDLIKAVHTAFDAVLGDEPNAEQRRYGTRGDRSVSAPRSA
jgi:plasmid stabilization system protein ParE